MDVDSDAARQILSSLIDSGLNDPQIFWPLIYSFKNTYKKIIMVKLPLKI